MHEFKQTTAGLATNLVAALGGGMLVLFLWSMIWEPNLGAWIAGGAAAVGVGFYLIWSEAARVVVQEGELRMSKNGKITHSYKLAECDFRVRMSSPGLVSPFTVTRLYVNDRMGEGEQVMLDLSGLGHRQCEQLFRLIKADAHDYVEEGDPRVQKRRKKLNPYK